MRACGTILAVVTVCRPRFSPDGTRIVFARCADLTCDIYLMDPDGSNVEPLTSGDRLGSRPDRQTS